MSNKFPEKFLEQKSLTLNSLKIQLNLPPIRTDFGISNPSVKKKKLKKVSWLSLVSPIYIKYTYVESWVQAKFIYGLVQR